MNRNPCKGCEKRTITCHGVCKEYQEFKKAREEELAWMREQRSVTNYRWERAHLEKVRRKARGWDRRPKDYD